MQQIAMLAIVGAVAAILGVGYLNSFTVNSGGIGSGSDNVDALAGSTTVSYRYNGDEDEDGLPDFVADVEITWDQNEVSQNKPVQVGVILAGHDQNNNEIVIASAFQAATVDLTNPTQTVTVNFGFIDPTLLEDVDHSHVVISDAP